MKRRLVARAPAIFAAALLVFVQGSCIQSAVRPILPPAEDLILNGSFERRGVPTLAGWRLANPSLAILVPEAAPGGGAWSLELDADWAPTTGFVTMPIAGIRDGDVLSLSAFVRAVDAEGGGSIALAVGPSYRLGIPSKQASTANTSWTLLSVQDTVSLAPGDTVWVVLSSFNTEIQPRRGRFDRVTMRRILDSVAVR